MEARVRIERLEELTISESGRSDASGRCRGRGGRGSLRVRVW